MALPQSQTQPTKSSSSPHRGDMHEQLHLPTLEDQQEERPVGGAKTYMINEVFLSIQGEGVRAGTVNIFVRFSACNLRCEKGVVSDKSPGNFDCDTEFASGRALTLYQLYALIKKVDENCAWLILTGGEPALQVNGEFCNYFHQLGYFLAIETNGSVELPKTDGGDHGREALDWITVSPKVAEHCIRQKHAHEVKYVRGYGQGIPKTVVTAQHYCISPAFDGSNLDRECLQWCIKLVKENPQWRLSVQQHKTTFGGVR